MIEETLKTTLDSLGYPVFPLKKPQNVDLPVIIYKRISNPKLRTQSGSTDLRKARFQIDIFTSTYAEGKEITEQVEDLLERNRTSWDLSIVIGSRDIEEENYFRNIVEVFIYFKEV